MDEATITTTYNSLLNAMQAYYIAGEHLIRVKAEMETTRLAAIRDGLITGKNDDERKASAYLVLKDLYHELAVAEMAEREKKYILSCAEVFVEQTRALLRLEELRMAAGVAAEKVRKTGVPYEFSPMSSRERRIVHLALREESDLRTESQGEGARRCLVVYPKDYKPAAKPMRRR